LPWTAPAHPSCTRSSRRRRQRAAGWWRRPRRAGPRGGLECRRPLCAAAASAGAAVGAAAAAAAPPGSRARHCGQPLLPAGAPQPRQQPAPGLVPILHTARTAVAVPFSLTHSHTPAAASLARPCP
jgi:hypothetical protein